MKKLCLFAISGVFALSLILFRPSFAYVAKADGDDGILRIYSWEDYIYEEEDEESPDYGMTLVDMFERDYEAATGEDIQVEYTTFGTNEIMYNNILINPGRYDLVCPSDYMIQKLIAEGRLEKFDDVKADVPHFAEYGSPYMHTLFENNGWTDYAIPFTWGTLGFIYNPEFVSEEDVSTWECVTDFDYANRTTIKDSVRDTYFLGIALANIDELREKNEAYRQNAISREVYSQYLAEVFNDTSDETIKNVEGFLKQAKANAFSLEVDSGKDDIVKGNVYINFAWSGDAVYALCEAEADDDMELRYAVPNEGSNIWFDGWCMPKGANKKLAAAFLDYISTPSNAILNMQYIGYTTAVAGEEVFESLLEEDVDDEDKMYRAYRENAEDRIEVDLSYFFGDIDGGAKLYIDAENFNRQLLTQFPTEDIIDRCAVMEYFPDEENEKINAMWNRVRAGDIWLSIVVIICVLGGLALAVLLYVLIAKDVFRKPVKKGCKLISVTPVK